MNQDSLDSIYQLQQCWKCNKYQINFHFHLINAAFLTQRNVVHASMIYEIICRVFTIEEIKCVKYATEECEAITRY